MSKQKINLAQGFLIAFLTTLTLAGCGSGGEASSLGLLPNAGVVTTLAGSTTPGSADGTGGLAGFNQLYDVATDTSGNIYVADTNNHMIRKITPAGVVSTLAGSTTHGSTNGTGNVAQFNNPMGVCVDSGGNVYVADSSNNMIRKITSTGVVTTLAGSTTSGSSDGTGSSAKFNYPTSVAVDSGGNVYVADSGNNMIRKITAAGVVTTLAGSTTAGSSDGNGSSASFNWPSGVTLDESGNLYVGDYSNNTIRKITSAGVVTTLAGSTTSGSTDGTSSAARFYGPTDVAADSNGDLYIADSGNNMIRKITAAGVVTTLAGSSTVGHLDGTGAAATFNNPTGVAVDSTGTVYVADLSNNLVRKIR